MDTRPAAYCVIVRDDQILLTHYCTKTAEGQPISGWTLPGGGMDPGEQPAQSAMREVFEETGYRVEIEDLVGVHAGYFERADSSIFCALRTVFTARIVSGDFQVEQEGSTDDARWVPLAELHSYIPQQGAGSHFLSAVVGLMGFDSPQQWAARQTSKTAQEA